LTVCRTTGDSRLDWDWFAAREAAHEGRYVRHLHLAKPLCVLIDGHKRQGVILPPDHSQDCDT
ncbi:hypothetical protein CSB20_05530, partial [bacterium DOLZORAL124_64_63]